MFAHCGTKPAARHSRWLRTGAGCGARVQHMPVQHGSCRQHSTLSAPIRLSELVGVDSRVLNLHNHMKGLVGHTCRAGALT